MKKFLLLLLSLQVFVITNAQETFGNPTSPTPVSGYTGFSISSQKYSGNAMIDSYNPPNLLPFFSGGGNVIFNNVPNTTLTLKNIKGAPHGQNIVNPISSIGVQFLMHNADTNNLSDFKIEISYDSVNFGTAPIGVAYSLIPAWYNPTNWSVMRASIGGLSSLPTFIDSSKIVIRFIQNSTTKVYRIDDIYFTYLGLLNNKNFTLNAQKQLTHTKLSWQSINSSVYDYFEIEKSINNGFTYSKIGQQAVTNPNRNVTYDFFDKEVNTSLTVLYRIKLIGADGKQTFSNVQKINNTKSFNLIDAVYPTVSTNQITLSLSNLANKEMNIIMQNLEGKKVFVKKLDNTMQKASILIPVSDLPNGVYLITAFNGEMVETKKIMVQN